MTRRYEIVYIFDSALDEGQIDQALAKYHALLKDKDNPEPVKETNHWGKRTLAYPIGKAPVGHYVVVDIHTDPVHLPEFERAVKLDPQVIRYLLVLNEGEAPRPMVHPDDQRDRDGGPEAGRRDADKSDAGKEKEAVK